MKKELIEAMRKSPHWKEGTEAINAAVEVANAEGVKLPAQVMNSLREIRMLTTIMRDENVRKLVADDLYEALRARSKA